ncbi:hypothetical protein [Magnetospira sp. QH-2]|uniref:hypothetical protein n=1 Tax=Magnetospira sp. (strain QH-2) TaxID=1288970 RepID=UPI0003E81C2A|nr:hypothetical protein [Magnetospira sp. QH-2]CCQ74796.1 protein of unknown function [Magnetospira sp. QH-2]
MLNSIYHWLAPSARYKLMGAVLLVALLVAWLYAIWWVRYGEMEYRLQCYGGDAIWYWVTPALKPPVFKDLEDLLVASWAPDIWVANSKMMARPYKVLFRYPEDRKPVRYLLGRHSVGTKLYNECDTAIHFLTVEEFGENGRSLPHQLEQVPDTDLLDLFNFLTLKPKPPWQRDK